MKRFAVIGLGRFGEKLAIALAQSGAEVIAIDRERAVIDDVRDQVSLSVRMDSTDLDALRSVGVDRVDCAIVGMGQGGHAFEAAIMTVVNLKNLGVKQICARAQDNTTGQVFTAVGATDIIYPEIEAAQRWAYKLIAPQIKDKIDFAPGYSLASLTAPESFDAKTVMDLQLRQRFNVNLVAVKRSDDGPAAERGRRDVINVPLPETVIHTGDILMVVGSDEDIARLPQE